MERIVVWGLILGLGGLAGFEALTRTWHQQSVDAVDTAFRNSFDRVDAFMESEEMQERIQAHVARGVSDEFAELRALDEVVEADPDVKLRLTISEAESHMSGFPEKSIELIDTGSAVATYQWKTLFKDYGGIRVHYMLRRGEIRNLTDFTADDME